MGKRLTIILTAVLLVFGWVQPATSLARESAVQLNELSDHYRGDSVTITGTTSLKELNVKVVNSQGTIIYVNTLQPQSGGAYSDLFTLSATEALGKATVVVGEGNVTAVREFLIIAPSSGGGGGGGNGGGGGGGNGGGSGGTGGSGSDNGGNAGGSGSGESDGGTPSTPGTGVEVYVNGKAETAGSATTATVRGQLVTTVSIDPGKLAKRLAAEGQHAVITIPMNTASDVVVGQLNGQMVSSMERQQATVELQTANATYRLPAEQINIQAISAQLGKSIELADIAIRIAVAKPTGDTAKLVEDSAVSGGFKLVAPPLNFTIQAVHGNTTIDVTRFHAYVERTIALPAGVEPGQVTTAVVIDPDGSVRHVPTQVVVIGGKYHAKINSLTNSTYSVIWNPTSFRDVERHWAQDAVNDMGSRMVINGVGQGEFAPDRAITRAEFAAIIVRGLGLQTEKRTNSFSDVKTTDWYNGSINTAQSYELISGFEDGTFRPTENITREQAMVMLSKAMKMTGLQAKQQPNEGEPLRSFSDAGQVSAWAAASIADCLKAGLVSGRADQRLEPVAPISRAEVAILVQRLLQKSGLI
ncbi:hypothetical protein J31TS4_35140 [Paenibacillus sp. J31TS4]|uniref:S-layer homology domain-containing protein n=1 Tax=Paenibacillus sp. J31TS4 TaxID=2807195 RepID=UPI001B15D9F0|nr:S-layer homology domain-containing protein [Paenibacillus sp. J31TS4]GIP40234.1 hypothetical protein J31TS4_35140 [Paenibacillus sp. J31TS4]